MVFIIHYGECMFGINYIKTSPTTHIIHYRNGKMVREGAGLSFFYYAPTSLIALVPAGSIDVPFIFNEVTADFQDVTVQGELTFRIIEPSKIAELLDFSVDSREHYISDDPEKLHERLIHATQIIARSFTQSKTLREVLTASEELVEKMNSELPLSSTVTMLGVEIVGLSILSIQATPEMAKALQAEARSNLLREADEAVHERRNAAVEHERAIKENEMRTKILVEQKQREVREVKMAASIAVEEQRAELVELSSENKRKEAEAKGEALRMTMEPLKEVDWRLLLAMGGNMGSSDLIAMAFRDLADNAGKIGELNISPDLLDTLTRGGK